MVPVLSCQVMTIETQATGERGLEGDHCGNDQTSSRDTISHDMKNSSNPASNIFPTNPVLCAVPDVSTDGTKILCNFSQKIT